MNNEIIFNYVGIQWITDRSFESWSKNPTLNNRFLGKIVVWVSTKTYVYTVLCETLHINLSSVQAVKDYAGQHSQIWARVWVNIFCENSLLHLYYPPKLQIYPFLYYDCNLKSNSVVLSNFEPLLYLFAKDSISTRQSTC